VLPGAVNSHIDQSVDFMGCIGFRLLVFTQQ